MISALGMSAVYLHVNNHKLKKSVTNLTEENDSDRELAT